MSDEGDVILSDTGGVILSERSPEPTPKSA
jgi:hypothetical protein